MRERDGCGASGLLAQESRQLLGIPRPQRGCDFASARSESPVRDKLEGGLRGARQLGPTSQDRDELGFAPGVGLGSGLGLLSGT
jgi:hypothetical protein